MHIRAVLLAALVPCSAALTMTACGPEGGPRSNVLPTSIALSPDTRYLVLGAAVVSAEGGQYGPLTAHVQIVDLMTMSSRAIGGSNGFPGPETPAAIVPGGNVAAWSAGVGLAVLDLTTGYAQFVGSSGLGGFPNGDPVVVSSSSVAVPVALEPSSFVAFVDVGSLAIDRLSLGVTYAPPYTPMQMRFRAASGKLYVATGTSSGVEEIDVAGRTVLRKIATGAATDVEISPDGVSLFATISGAQEVRQFDLATGAQIGGIASGGEERLSLAGSPSGVFSFDRVRGTSHVIDFATGLSIEGPPFWWAPVPLVPPSSFTPGIAFEPSSRALIDVATGVVTEARGALSGRVAVRLPDGRVVIARQISSRERVLPNPVPDELAILGTGITANSTPSQYVDVVWK